VSLFDRNRDFADSILIFYPEILNQCDFGLLFYLESSALSISFLMGVPGIVHWRLGATKKGAGVATFKGNH